MDEKGISSSRQDPLGFSGPLSVFLRSQDRLGSGTPEGRDFVSDRRQELTGRKCTTTDIAERGRGGSGPCGLHVLSYTVRSGATTGVSPLTVGGPGPLPFDCFLPGAATFSLSSEVKGFVDVLLAFQRWRVWILV